LGLKSGWRPANKLYMVVDIFSRRIVGWDVHDEESSDLPFETIEAARAWVAGFVTPDQRHFGHETALLAKRAHLYALAQSEPKPLEGGHAPRGGRWIRGVQRGAVAGSPLRAACTNESPRSVRRIHRTSSAILVAVTEFERIDIFTSLLPHPRAPHGPGDDCAVLPPSRAPTCVTTDAVVEHIHFTRPAFSLADIGHKALAVNLSDLAAMGAKPTWWLCALGLPKTFTANDLRALATGLRPLAVEHGLQLLGGNVTASPVLTLTLTLAGEAKRPLLRSKAKPGQLLYVTGTLGGAAAGLHLPKLRAMQRRPTPQVKLGLQAARRNASAAIDISDGLLADLGHLCTASGVRANLASAALPIHPLIQKHPRGLDWALNGGEDYQLLVSSGRDLGAGFTCIGEVLEGTGVTLDGCDVASKGFDHFRTR